MRIHHSDLYFHLWNDIGCPFRGDCERLYCKDHRYLYRECETDYGYGISRDCPKCHRQFLKEKAARMEAAHANRT